MAFPYPREVEYLTLARVFIAQGQGAAVQGLLARLLQEAKANQRLGSLMEILMLQALVWQAQDDLTSALTALKGALALAEPEGYIRIFLDEGAPMRELLRQAQAAGIAPNYVHKLLAAFPAEASQISPLTSRISISFPLLVEPLTERELELLHLVAAGLTNGEIAEKLFLAVGTVKKHLNNIFGKLDVSNRTQAIARARELELL